MPVIRMPIRLKITLPYIFLAFVISIGIGIISVRVILENVDERFTNQLYEVGKLAADGMVQEENRLLSTFRLLANTKGVPAAINQNDSQKLRELLLGVVVNNREEDVEILDPQGNLVLSMHHVQGGLVEEYTYSQAGGLNVKNWELVKKVLLRQSDQSGDKYSAMIATEWGDYFYVAGPVLDETGQFAGVIVVGKSLNSLVTFLRTTTTAQVTIYNMQGQVLASTFSKPFALSSELSGIILSNQDTSGYRRNPDFRDLNLNDLSYGEVLGPWEGRDKADWGILGTALVKNALVTTSQPARQMLILLILVVVFFTVIFGINLADQITRPLLTLVRASRIVSQGDLHIQVPPTTSDEIADLTKSFNDMVSSLLQSKMDLVQAYDSTLVGWSKALELRDKETQGHSQRVTDLTVALASELGIQDVDIANIRRGAILHDIGKMGIPDEILLKPGPLTDEEWIIMRRHPQHAFNMLKPILYLVSALDIPYCHHERWDGTGYPRGLKGEKIPLAARIFALADVWDSLTSERPYRKPMTRVEALNYIKNGSGNHFDPNLVEKFIDLIERINSAHIAIKS